MKKIEWQVQVYFTFLYYFFTHKKTKILNLLKLKHTLYVEKNPSS